MGGGGGLVAGLRVVVVAVLCASIWLGLMGGCALPQAEVCRVYVACQNAVDASVETADWDEGGRCWSLPDTARQCEAQCQAALDALLETPAPPAACTP